ncbi:hypothetical protein N7462_001165 [Penicillium macrosclerotiorum]|uniref:uncharacterized protein n=1 Tax=Penicillium macrosclerotiorum TaxID=303699 RepID=UPI002546ABC4|nr:uncharacterized protein N7462_001165 [Penicillium macrosclerotiorum]KAJ5691742.1 hypothetical protein N7462_001165 [Penicillium macrosclerotiorum]
MEIWSVYEESLGQKASLSSSKVMPMVVLDLGTGTGGTLRGLAHCALERGQDLSNARLIGIDISQQMLLRAEKRTSELGSAESVEWVLGDATDLLARPELSGLQHQVDLLIFADGGFSLLKELEGIDKFFSQVALFLRPGTGRVFLEVYDYSEQPEAKYDPSLPEADYEGGFKETEELCKKGIIPFTIQELKSDNHFEDGYYFENLTAKVVTKDSQGKETILEVVEYKTKSKIWKADELVQQAKKAGLESTEVKEIGVFRFFTFRVPGEY